MMKKDDFFMNNIDPVTFLCLGLYFNIIHTLNIVLPSALEILGFLISYFSIIRLQ